MRAVFPRRSLLYIPGSSQKMLDKAPMIQVDAVILDLEDAVSISEKAQAREKVASIIPELKNTDKEIIVRINSADTLWCYEDICAIANKGIDAVVVPKADDRSLVSVDLMLGSVEERYAIEAGSIKIIPLFETAFAIVNAFELLGKSNRINGVQLGAEDLTKDQEITRTSSGQEILYARQHLAMAARAKKIDILDTPYTDIKDLDGLTKDSIRARNLGFTGKACIHPSHIEIINQVFSPSPEEINHASEITKAYQASLDSGNGACMYNNKMIDKPVAERAQLLISKAKRLGLF
jgi:citrate lyase subunit beta/citryl-CoA lyase